MGKTASIIQNKAKEERETTPRICRDLGRITPEAPDAAAQSSSSDATTS